MSDKLFSRDIVVIVLFGGLLWAGQSVWKQKISEAAKVRIAETQSEERAAALQTLVDLSKEETERLGILERAYDAKRLKMPIGTRLDREIMADVDAKRGKESRSALLGRLIMEWLEQ